jgi:hypothetical protein
LGQIFIFAQYDEFAICQRFKLWPDEIQLLGFYYSCLVSEHNVNLSTFLALKLEFSSKIESHIAEYLLLHPFKMEFLLTLPGLFNNPCHWLHFIAIKNSEILKGLPLLTNPTPFIPTELSTCWYSRHPDDNIANRFIFSDPEQSLTLAQLTIG